MSLLPLVDLLDAMQDNVGQVNWCGVVVRLDDRVEMAQVDLLLLQLRIVVVGDVGDEGSLALIEKWSDAICSGAFSMKQSWKIHLREPKSAAAASRQTAKRSASRSVIRVLSADAGRAGNAVNAEFFDPVVQILRVAMIEACDHLAVCDLVTAEFVGDDHPARTPNPFEQLAKEHPVVVVETPKLGSFAIHEMCAASPAGSMRAGADRRGGSPAIQ